MSTGSTRALPPFDLRCLGGGVLAVLLALPAAASTKAECIKASDEGQDLRDQGKLLAARERFVACGLDACPSIVRAQCQEWLADVEKRTPTVLLRARDDAEKDLVDVSVSIDGQPSQAATGRSVPLDPGVHLARFEAVGYVALELKVLILESEKDRLLDATLHRAQPSDASRPLMSRAPLAVPVLTITSGVVAVAGAVLFAVYGADAKARVEHLRATCAPGCSTAQVSYAQQQAVIANVSLVAGAVGAAGAITLLLWRPLWRAPAVAVGPAPGGLMGWLTASF